MTLLASSHNYNLLHSWQRAAHWEHYNSSSKQLWKTRDSVGQTLGILGYGSIGRQVARVGKAMGMKVLAYTASQRKTEESKRDSGFIVDGTGDPDGSIPSAWFFGFDKEKLHEFLRQDIDVLLVSVPLTKATTKILGKEEFEILGRKNAFISNISRGKIIDQDALITSLRQFDDDSKTSPSSNHHLDNPQQSPPQPSISQSSSEPSPSQPSSLPSSQLTKKRGLRGAALDVTDPEPLPDGHPLWTTPNCIVTPHISGLGDKYIERAFEVLKLNLDRFERGEKLVNVVDRERGY